MCNPKTRKITLTRDLTWLNKDWGNWSDTVEHTVSADDDNEDEDPQGIPVSQNAEQPQAETKDEEDSVCGPPPPTNPTQR